MKSPTVISLYSGAGGLDYGFEAAGFQTSVALEIDHDSCETLRYSRADWRVMERDIFETSEDEILETANLRPGEADVLIGGPPCQPFSKAGYWVSGDAKRLADPRADTLSAYIRVLKRVQPRAFLLENVQGLAFSGKDEGLKYLLNQIEQVNLSTGSNYRPTVQILNAASFGVPQLRERVFVVAFRDGQDFQFPKATHCDSTQFNSQLNFDDASRSAFTTAWDAIGDVTPDANEDLEIRGKWAGLLSSIPEGQNYLWHTDRGGGKPLFGWRRRYWSFLLKLAKGRPSWTLQAQPGPAIGPFHWENRRLSMREMCRIQTFPDSVTVLGTRSSVQKQIGNAVPSLLAEVLACQIRWQLLKDLQMSRRPTLLPETRTPIPPPGRTRKVRAEYLKLEGVHEPHPGTGLGFAASQRSSN